MKKALVVANTLGFITSFLANDIELLEERGYKVSVACNTNYTHLNTKEFVEKYGLTVIDVGFPIRTLEGTVVIDAVKKIKKALRKDKYDLIHCHTTIAAVLTRCCIHDNAVKVIYTSHGFPFYKGNFGLKERVFFEIEKYYSKYTDAIITICKEDFENAKRMLCKKVYLIPGVGVDLNRFNIKKFDREFYREQLGFSKNDRVVLSIGEINSNKNHKVVINALAKIQNEHLIYAICGRELNEKGKKAELEELAKSLGVRVLFLGFRGDIPQVCLSADIGAITSFKEGLGVSGIEMLAAGLPLVGSNRQGIKDYVVNGVTGFLVEPSDSDSVASAIEKCLNISLQEKTKYNCIKMSEKFALEASKSQMKKIYDDILE